MAPVRVALTFQPKTYDIDFAGVVSNIVYIRWLEDLRLKILDVCAPLNDSLARGEGPVLLETQIHYRKPVRIQDRVEGAMSLTRAGGVRWEVEGRFHARGELVAEARQKGVYINLKSGRPVRLPTGLEAGD